ncbi:PAS domain-containing protein [Azospirillum agricola]|uniref:PAS domain-containing protein n=1 Tax=Azospirillum agricola TaxID=1720247 RepID=UPI000A0F350D|nr:PAS domain-containing protein [Azospirillum agricola]SMH53113.1 PAS fold-containing protein [Azospirillum lipoferum]
MTKERTELATPYLSGLLDFWLTKSTGGRPPSPTSIAPADLRPWKDNIVVFEVIGDDAGDGGAFVYSYYGKALAAAFGHSRLGATVDVLPAEQRAILQPEYDTVRRERRPVARVYTAEFAGRTRSWERLVLPMSSDGAIIDKLLVAAYEVTARPAAASPGANLPADSPPAGGSPSPEMAPDAAVDQPPAADQDTDQNTEQKPGASA